MQGWLYTLTFVEDLSSPDNNDLFSISFVEVTRSTDSSPTKSGKRGGMWKGKVPSVMLAKIS